MPDTNDDAHEVDVQRLFDQLHLDASHHARTVTGPDIRILSTRRRHRWGGPFAVSTLGIGVVAAAAVVILIVASLTTSPTAKPPRLPTVSRHTHAPTTSSVPVTTTTPPNGGSAPTATTGVPTTVVPTTTPATVSSSATAVSIPLVTCPTTYGISGVTARQLPATASVVLPAALESQLAAYTDLRGAMEIIAPRGWTCVAGYGADGSGGVGVFPPGTAPATFFQTNLPVEGIVGIESSACSGCTLDQACPLFPSAASALKAQGYPPCVARPKAEQVDPISTSLVAFLDPPGVKGDGDPSGGPWPANGVMIYNPGAPNGSYLETCTGPASLTPTCTAALNAFSTAYGSL